MKRRAKEQGANEAELAKMQRLAVEELIAGLDFNPVSMQLAAAQLTAGNTDVAYRRMNLHRMPYGPRDGGGVSAGSLELLGQSAIVKQLDLGDREIDSERLRMSGDDPLLENAVDAVRNACIAIMNPPFTNRTKMGGKFERNIQKNMRDRVDHLEGMLVAADSRMEGFGDKNSIRPLFVALADKCLDPEDGVLGMINPTIALTTTSGRQERIVLAQRFHIHTLVTCHQPGQISLSQNTAINESMIIARRHDGPKPPTRIIGLDRMPLDENDVAELCRHLEERKTGLLPDGWGEVSEWPTRRIEVGDWSAAAFRSPELAEAAMRITNDASLLRLRDQRMIPAATGQLLRGKFKASHAGVPGSFPILKSKGADGQMRIRAMPDEYWAPKEEDGQTESILKKSGYLLISAGQRTGTGRLSAVASENRYVGNGWMPVSGMSKKQAKAAAVFLSSTIGRLQLMRNPGRTLDFPTYSAEEAANLRTPDLTDQTCVERLARCWEHTAKMIVPQFRDGECEVRRLWDEAVASALGWDEDHLTTLRQLLHREPHVRGLGCNQYG